MINKEKMCDNSDGLLQCCNGVTKFKKAENNHPNMCLGNTSSVDVRFMNGNRNLFTAGRYIIVYHVIRDQKHPTILCKSLMRPIFVNAIKTKQEREYQQCFLYPSSIFFIFCCTKGQIHFIFHL